MRNVEISIRNQFSDTGCQMLECFFENDLLGLRQMTNGQALKVIDLQTKIKQKEPKKFYYLNPDGTIDTSRPFDIGVFREQVFGVLVGS